MVYVFIVLIFISLLIVSSLLLVQPEDLAAAKEKSYITESKFKLGNKLNELEIFIQNQNPDINNLIGDQVFFKFIFPSLILFILAFGFLGPILAGKSLGFILGLVIFLAYSARIYLIHANNFRTHILNELEKIFISIRNNLSTGLTLDNAVRNCLKFNKEKPLAPHLKEFVRITEVNFIEQFPLWLVSVEQTFKIKGLSFISQLLKLELKYNNNQEEAFLLAAANLSDKISTNKKQRNTINISLLTMDFLVLLFLGVIFYIIPSLNVGSELTWWESARRPVAIFISGSALWLSYFITIIITIRRQN